MSQRNKCFLPLFTIISIFLCMHKNIHEAKLLQPITSRRLNALSWRNVLMFIRCTYFLPSFLADVHSAEIKYNKCCNKSVARNIYIIADFILLRMYQNKINAAISRKRNASVWRPSVRLSHLFLFWLHGVLFLILIVRAAYTQRYSPGGSTRCTDFQIRQILRHFPNFSHHFSSTHGLFPWPISNFATFPGFPVPCGKYSDYGQWQKVTGWIDLNTVVRATCT